VPRITRPTALASLVALLILPAVAYPNARVINDSSASTLPITERVVQGEMAGLPPAGGVRSLTSAKATVAALDSDNPAADLTALRRSGFTRAALQRFGNGRSTNGLSLVIQLGSPALARKELARNAAPMRRDAAVSKNGTNNGTTGKVWTLRRIPGSTGFDEHFRGDHGAAIEFAGVIFSEGPFYYLVFVGGPDRRIDGRDAFDAAAALYTRVHGPAPVQG
jgi:hypothetical protein